MTEKMQHKIADFQVVIFLISPVFSFLFKITMSVAIHLHVHVLLCILAPTHVYGISPATYDAHAPPITNEI